MFSGGLLVIATCWALDAPWGLSGEIRRLSGSSSLFTRPSHTWAFSVAALFVRGWLVARAGHAHALLLNICPETKPARIDIDAITPRFEIRGTEIKGEVLGVGAGERG